MANELESSPGVTPEHCIQTASVCVDYHDSSHIVGAVSVGQNTGKFTRGPPPSEHCRQTTSVAVDFQDAMNMYLKTAPCPHVYKGFPP